MNILTGPVSLDAFSNSSPFSISASSVPGKESIFIFKKWINYSHILLINYLIYKTVVIIKWQNWLLKKSYCLWVKIEHEIIFNLKTTYEKW